MRGLAWAGLLLMGLAACGDDSGGAGGEGGGDETTAASGSTTTGDATTAASTSTASNGSSSSGGNAHEEPFLCEETDFVDDFPLSGPGFDPETGIVGEPQETYLVATTQIYVRPEKAGDFFPVAAAVIETLGESEGMLAWGIGSSEKCGDSRTLSIWASEEAMLSFVASDAHAAAMMQSTDLAFTGRTTHWEVTAEELLELDWDVARAKVEDVEAFY